MTVMDNVQSEDERVVEILKPFAEGAESTMCCLVNLSARYIKKRLLEFQEIRLFMSH